MKPAVDALARRCRVITFSLADEPTCGGRFDEKNGFDSYVDQVAEAMDLAGIERAAICGVSYGGLDCGGLRGATSGSDGRRSILVSALPPSWRPNERAEFYLRAPRLLCRRSSCSRRCGCTARWRRHGRASPRAPWPARGMD